MNAELQRAIAATIGGAFMVVGADRVGGGCINRAWRVRGTDGESLFVKTNGEEKLEMFAAEAEALIELAAAQAVRIPRVIGRGCAGGQAFLVLEWIDLVSTGDAGLMGRQLAALHRVVSADGRFGWRRDNVIGETSQANAWCDSWAEFFIERRLRPQLEMAASGGWSFANTDPLMLRAAELLSMHRPQASLLHGDLWSGNAGFASADGAPVLFDPATYFGDRETDLAFSELFGGFGAEFYRNYEKAYPLSDGYPQRKPLYNLYHVLNHLNLFGGGYAEQARRLMAALLV